MSIPALFTLLPLLLASTAGLPSIPPFSAERDALQYVVAIDGQGAAPWPTDAPVTPMTDHKGRRYECAVPPANPPTDDTSAAKAIEGKSPLDLLETLATKCLYRTIDWWTYEVCYKQHVRQFHNDPATNKLASEYLLGNYDPAGDQPAVQADSGIEGLSSTPSRYVAQRYTNGEACDVTDEPRLRSTEVRFVCAADGRDLLVGVTEPQTCQYVITVATKMLCRHEAFQVKEPVPAVVRCRPVDDMAEDDELQLLEEAALAYEESIEDAAEHDEL